MKLIVLTTLACCTFVSAHPGIERVKRQSSSSGSSTASTYSSGAPGGSAFAFSGAGGLPFGDLFSSFPGFDQGPPADVGLFSRISPIAPVYAGPGVSSSFSSSVSNGNGGGITFTESNVDGHRSGSTTQVDPSGRVTSYQHGTGTPGTISTRVLSPGQSTGIYSASGVTNNNGNVSAYRAGGAIN